MIGLQQPDYNQHLKGKFLWIKSGAFSLEIRAMPVEYNNAGINVQTKRSGLGGGGVWVQARHLNTSFVPSLEILTTNFTPNNVFVNPTKGYFITSELFSSPKSREFDQKNEKNSNAAPMPVPSSPSKLIDTIIKREQAKQTWREA